MVLLSSLRKSASAGSTLCPVTLCFLYASHHHSIYISSLLNFNLQLVSLEPLLAKVARVHQGQKEAEEKTETLFFLPFSFSKERRENKNRWRMKENDEEKYRKVCIQDDKWSVTGSKKHNCM